MQKKSTYYTRTEVIVSTLVLMYLRPLYEIWGLMLVADTHRFSFTDVLWHCRVGFREDNWTMIQILLQHAPKMLAISEWCECEEPLANPGRSLQWCECEEPLANPGRSRQWCECEEPLANPGRYRQWCECEEPLANRGRSRQWLLTWFTAVLFMLHRLCVKLVIFRCGVLTVDSWSQRFQLVLRFGLHCIIEAIPAGMYVAMISFSLILLIVSWHC